MRYSKNMPVYSQVAYDIASQIAKGTLKEGQKFSGRSLMGAQYGVSPETIRRALNLLAGMNIIEIKPNAGATIISLRCAIEYVEQYRADNDLRALKTHLWELVAERDRLNEEIRDIFEKIMDLDERFKNSDQLRTYEFRIKGDSHAAGKTIGELEFRQKTGGTIIAVREDGKLELSPGPSTVLREGDVLVVACNVTDLSFVAELVE